MSIVEKLKLARFEKKAIINCPTDCLDYFTVLGHVDTAITEPVYDLIFHFVYTLEELTAAVLQYVQKNAISKSGYIYLAYPKKNNKKYPTSIGRDDILPAFGAEETGFVFDSTIKFSRMVSLDANFTVIGLKYDSIKVQKTPPASQLVADYAARVPELEQSIQIANKEVFDIFQKLTPGYKRSWARYVYSTKTEATQAKRFAELQTILQLGFKSKDLYQQSLKK